MDKTEGTTETLRTLLFGELELLKAGKITVQKATVTYKIASQILSAAKLDLEHYKLVKMLEGKVEDYPITPVALIG